MKPDHLIEAKITDLAAKLEDALREHYGSDRGFAILVFKAPHGAGEGDGYLLTNIGAEYLSGLMRDTLETMEIRDPGEASGLH